MATRRQFIAGAAAATATAATAAVVRPEDVEPTAATQVSSGSGATDPALAEELKRVQTMAAVAQSVPFPQG